MARERRCVGAVISDGGVEWRRSHSGVDVVALNVGRAGGSLSRGDATRLGSVVARRDASVYAADDIDVIVELDRRCDSD